MYLEDMSCRVCLDSNSYEDEEHTFRQCKILIEDKTPTINFQDVYGTLPQQISFIKHAMPIIRKRNILLKYGKNDDDILT